MRLVALAFLGLTCCDSFAERPAPDQPTSPSSHPGKPVTDGTAGIAGSAGSGGSLVLEVGPVLTLGGAPSLAPAPEPEWCEEAERNGATFCEADEPYDLEYCEPAPADGLGCIGYDLPPSWVYDLVLQCYAHCGVGIVASERVLEGSCCYTAWSQYGGR